MVKDGCPCGCRRSTRDSDLRGHENECSTACGPGQIAVRVSNSYECGRRSGWVQILDAPPATVPDVSLDDWLHDNLIVGDGHPCGSREHAIYQFEVVSAAERCELVGRTGGGEG